MEPVTFDAIGREIGRIVAAAAWASKGLESVGINATFDEHYWQTTGLDKRQLGQQIERIRREAATLPGIVSKGLVGRVVDALDVLEVLKDRRNRFVHDIWWPTHDGFAVEGLAAMYRSPYIITTDLRTMRATANAFSTVSQALAHHARLIGDIIEGLQPPTEPETGPFVFMHSRSGEEQVRRLAFELSAAHGDWRWDETQNGSASGSSPSP